jgi:para-nitrobenzyl esterase
VAQHLHVSARLLVALAITAAPLAPAAAARAASPTEVTINTGALRGVAAGGVIAFKGIPFAAPPIGDLRWRAPQPAAAWHGVRDAGHYGSDCMQTPFPSDAAPLGTPPAEDCLYANVWKPTAAKAKLPVLVWIYGGGFVNGGASPPTYSGAALAKQGILVFSFNYRLGRFGTFAHPQLTKTDADRGLIANYGYMDQLAALRWVQRNIARFGGDPANVTIVGESAGGMSVHMLVTSPMAKGLFARAVVQSGGPSPAGEASLASTEQIGVAFAQSKGIAADDPQALTKLRALSAEQVNDGLSMMALFRPAAGPRTFAAPFPDGRIAVDALGAYQAGRFAKVPMMVGATSDDIGGRTGMMVSGARNAAAILAGQNVPTYYYRFSYVAESARTPETKGAGHATDIPFFFDTADVKYGAATTATDRAAARLASGYLVNFVKSGNPNGPGLPAWGDYRGAGRPMLDLTARGTAIVGADPWAN